MPVLQSLSQARDKWGNHAVGAIWDASIVKVILGGTSSARDLQDLSALIGERDERTDTISVVDYGSRSLQRSTRRVPVMPQETIWTLPLGTALVLRSQRSAPGHRPAPVDGSQGSGSTPKGPDRSGGRAAPTLTTSMSDPRRTVSNMERRYDIQDLAAAQVNAARFGKKHPDLAKFHTARFRALALAFGIHDSAELSEFGKDALESLAASSIRMLIGLHSPFSNFLEAPKNVTDLHAQFGAAINSGIRQTETAIEGLLAGVLAELHGIPAGRTVGDEELRRHGFDPSSPWPDELDYW
jgi:hypothetical protein